MADYRPLVPAAAISNPLDLFDLGVSATPLERTSDGFRTTIRVDAADVLLFHANGRYSGNLVLEAVCDTADGRRMECAEPRQIALDLNERERDEALRKGRRFPFEFAVREASARIRVVVHDENPGASGSQTFHPEPSH